VAAAHGEERLAAGGAGLRRLGIRGVAVVDDPVVHQHAEPPLAADGQERGARGIHEHDLGAAAAGGVVRVDAEGEVAVGVEDGEAVAVEEQRPAPHRQHRGRRRRRVGRDVDRDSRRVLLWVGGVRVHLRPGHFYFLSAAPAGRPASLSRSSLWCSLVARAASSVQSGDRGLCVRALLCVGELGAWDRVRLACRTEWRSAEVEDELGIYTGSISSSLGSSGQRHRASHACTAPAGRCGPVHVLPFPFQKSSSEKKKSDLL